MAELDPKLAKAQAQAARQFLAGFNRSKYDNNFSILREDTPNPHDRRHLAIALDYVEELAAMVLSLADMPINMNTDLLPIPSVSDGSTAAYYELPSWAKELADLIRYKRMNGSQAEAFRCLYRGSEASHSDEQRQAKKLLAYAVDEVVRTHFPEESFAGYRNRVFAAIFGEQE